MKVFSILKEKIPALLLIVLLLILQARCDLALPNYTSDIINIGVQQKGIAEVKPKVIRKSELDKLLLFMKDEDSKEVLSSYKLISKDDDEYLDDYPKLKDENLYVLDKDNDELDTPMAKSILILSYIENNNTKATSEIPIPEGMSFTDFVLMLPKEQRDEMLKKIDEAFKDIPDMISEQSAKSYIANEYKQIGIDTEKLQTDYIFQTGFKMLGIALVSMASAVCIGFLGSRVAAFIARETRKKIFRKVLSFSSVETKRFGIASLITRSTNDVQHIQMFTVMFLRTVVYAPVLAIGALLNVMETNSSMTWIIALAIVCVLSLVITLFSIAVPKFDKIQKMVDKLNLVTREIITGIPVIRAFSNQDHERERFDDANKSLTKILLFVDRIMSCMMPIMMFIMNGVTLLIVWNGAKGIDNGTIQLGDMMAFIQYAMQIIMSFLMICMVSIILPRAVISLKRINEILTTDNAIKDPKRPKKMDPEKKGYVEFKNVSFAYPDASENVLSNISFVAEPGKTTAIIGSTGSGKSTLVNLVPRLYDATEGEILVDGVNVRQLKQNDLHRIIGYVPQTGILFSGDIESNIKYGEKDISDKDMEEAAKISQAEEFIKTKAKKYKSEISQGGTNVSGGQKQRLSIARAVAKKPEIFIFDDSFSALDYKTDAQLRKELKKNTKNATILIVAQRISTIMNAEQIIVLDDGNIVGIGTHKELLKSCNVYQEIASSQLGKEEL